MTFSVWLAFALGGGIVGGIVGIILTYVMRRNLKPPPNEGFASELQPSDPLYDVDQWIAAIEIRVDEGDPRTDWRPHVRRFARMARRELLEHRENFLPVLIHRGNTGDLPPTEDGPDKATGNRRD